jgi:hypothetical protein
MIVRITDDDDMRYKLIRFAEADSLLLLEKQQTWLQHLIYPNYNRLSNLPTIKEPQIYVLVCLYAHFCIASAGVIHSLMLIQNICTCKYL